MGILSGMFSPAEAQRSTAAPLGHPRDPVIAEWLLAGSNTSSGARVTPDSALALSTVFVCVRVIAETIASLPLKVYRQRDRGREPYTTHPLYRVLHTQTNRWQTAFEFREMMAGHCALRGVAYARIIGGGQAAVRELVPLHPDRVRPFFAPDGSVAYHYTPKDGPEEVLLQSEVHAWRGMSLDGLTPLSPIGLHRESIGLALTAQEHGARFFANGAAPSGVLRHPKTLTDQAVKRLREQWEQKYSGAGNAGRTIVLEEDMNYVQVGLNNRDAQYLETRKFQRGEIASLFRIPPHLIGDLEKATFSNIEHQGLEFVVHTMRPWFVRIEQAIARDLIANQMMGSMFAEFVVDGLLRGDITSRYTAYATGRQWGWLSVNDIRERENLNPLPPEQGDVYLSPLNMVRAEDAGQPPEEPPDGT